MEKRTIEITLYNQDDIPNSQEKTNYSCECLIEVGHCKMTARYSHLTNKWYDDYDNEVLSKCRFTWVYAEDVFK